MELSSPNYSRAPPGQNEELSIKPLFRSKMVLIVVFSVRSSSATVDCFHCFDQAFLTL